MYERYNALCPANQLADAFYLRPLEKWTYSQWYLYFVVPVGVDTSSSVVGRLAKDAGFMGIFSNDSVPATAAICLFRCKC